MLYCFTYVECGNGKAEEEPGFFRADVSVQITDFKNHTEKKNKNEVAFFFSYFLFLVFKAVNIR